MATEGFKYTHIHKLFCGGASWSGNEIKLALVSSGYTFDAAHTLFSQASSYELTAGDGYTTGGVALSGKTASNTALDADDVVFIALNKTFRGGILYFNGTIDTLVNPVIYYLLFNTTPADITVPTVDSNVIWNSGGIITL